MATSCAIAVALLTCPWGFGAFDAFSPVDDGVGPRRVVTEPVAPSAHFKHIVIGLGFAGAELASMLARDGKEFVAFEARHTYGGRAQSFSLESGDVMPKGASWQAGGGAAHPLTERIAECLVETQEQDWDDWTDYRASGEEADVPYDEFDTAIDCVAELAAHNLARGKDDMPLDVGLKLCGWWPVTQDDWLAETVRGGGVCVRQSARGAPLCLLAVSPLSARCVRPAFLARPCDWPCSWRWCPPTDRPARCLSRSTLASLSARLLLPRLPLPLPAIH